MDGYQFVADCIIVGIFVWAILYFLHGVGVIHKPGTTYKEEDYQKQAAAFAKTITCTDEEYEAYSAYVLEHKEACMQELREECSRFYSASSVDILMDFIDPTAAYARWFHGLYSPGNAYAVRIDSEKLRDIDYTSCHLIQMWVVCKYGKVSKKLAWAGYTFPQTQVEDPNHHGKYEMYLTWLEKEMHIHGVVEDLYMCYEDRVEVSTMWGKRYERKDLIKKFGTGFSATASCYHINFAPMLRGCPEGFIHKQY